MKRTIWDSMLDADLNDRYWGHLSSRYYSRDKFSKIFLAAMSSGTVASWGFWSDLPIVWKGLSAISALLAVALPILDWPKMIENMVNLKQKWAQIKTDYELLWLDVTNGADNKFIENELKKIKIKEAKFSQADANLPKDKKLINQAREEVIISRGLN